VGVERMSAGEHCACPGRSVKVFDACAD